VKDNNPRMDIDMDMERWLREANRCCDNCFDNKDVIASCDYEKTKDEDEDEDKNKSEEKTS